MKKGDIIFLKRRGFDLVTNHTLPAAHAYKVVKARRAINDAFGTIAKDEDACREAAGIKDGRAFDDELAKLRGINARTEEQDKRIAEMESQLDRFKELKDVMLNEDIKVDIPKMPYEEWHALQCENAEKEIGDRKVDILSGRAEDILEGVLWEAPAEVK